MMPAEAARALRCAQARYLAWPGVLGVAWGLKFQRGRSTGILGVQFWVRRKVRRPVRPLPRHVLGRAGSGRALRGIRFPTDVIETAPLRFACGAGSGLRAFGQRGTAALIFRDRSGGQAGAPAPACLVTCAHAAGGLERSPPLAPELRIEGPDGPRPFAVVLKNTTARRGTVEFDAALARILEAALPVPDLRIAGGGRILGLLREEDLEPGMVLDVACASGRRRGDLVSLAGEFRVLLNGRAYRVRNLFGLRIAVRPGDSGGLVHRRGLAAGILVARSPGGLAWWQPLGGALEALRRLQPEAPEPFSCYT